MPLNDNEGAPRASKRAMDIVGDWVRRARKLPLRYREEDFQRRTKYRPAYIPLSEALVRHLQFSTVLDMGCGNGFLMEPLVAAGKDVRGIELSSDVYETLPSDLKALVEISDFAQSSGQYDLVCCVEMAEHIVSSRSTELVHAVCARAKRWVYFSAAPPGQWGRGHINCRPHKEWIQWFKEEGWSCEMEITQRIHEDLKELHKAKWLRRNGFVFVPTDV